MSRANLHRAIDQGEFEGVPFKVTGKREDIEPGDTYLAERNSGVKLFTCKSHNRDENWIVPVEDGYLYDTWECVRIKLELGS